MTQSRLRALFALFAALVLAVGVAACGGDDDDDGDGGDTSANLIEENPDNNGVQVTVGSKNFTEQYILGEIFAQGLFEPARYDVKTQLNLGSEVIALRALSRTSARSTPTPSTRQRRSLRSSRPRPRTCPQTRSEAFEDSRAEFEQEGLTLVPPTPFLERERRRAAPRRPPKTWRSARSPISRANRRT